MLADDSNRNIIQAVALTPKTWAGTPSSKAINPGQYQTISILDAGDVNIGFSDAPDLTFTTTTPYAFTLDKTVNSITCSVAVILS